MTDDEMREAFFKAFKSKLEKASHTITLKEMTDEFLRLEPALLGDRYGELCQRLGEIEKRHKEQYQSLKNIERWIKSINYELAELKQEGEK